MLGRQALYVLSSICRRLIFIADYNDRDRVNDILALEKYLTDSFNISFREALHPKLHQDNMTVLNETHQNANMKCTN